RSTMSFEARDSTWCTPGRPLAVGGPSKKMKGRDRSPCPSARLTMPCSFHQSPISCSSLGKDTLGSTSLKAISIPTFYFLTSGGQGRRPRIKMAPFPSDTCPWGRGAQRPRGTTPLRRHLRLHSLSQRERV